ncbi:39S ribosomal protein L54, mitochondrial [Harpegnathos saltator]|uniref:Large ribosomal subunit protein mL54 n=1 Tax=Harpegnathos saltator TaxID=610380 RepID=E2B820_HARSA|nr:39S ribosomal protein L54, mitochondrial [Harpegnathos saltator]XP_011154321.1 39S ribosomal protein L54, mitochondrial [Harpegnathos saltator]XP_019701092.1 39S ribosomal protein L54, mitochondrial [Harpegnathos saltator]XP_025153431.1 39S ribosomal protein L54, mitochondrial [Harpegnathos saltator]EFN88162.1 39S ribosomal protein L54, mitochondrial [Harpegnathos saltator]
MNSIICRLFHFPKGSVLLIQHAIQARSYAILMSKKPKKSFSVSVEKKVLSVETDPYKLQSHVCGTNIYKEGEDVKIKSDSEYPSWLWNIRTGPPPPLEEMDPNTKQYWRRLRLLGLRRNNKIKGTKKF